MAYDDEEHDWELPEPDEDDDDDSVETVACPSCGRQIYEEAEQCPYCHTYVTHSTSVLAGKPIWFVGLAILGIIAVIVALLLY